MIFFHKYFVCALFAFFFAFFFFNKAIELSDNAIAELLYFEDFQFCVTDMYRVRDQFHYQAQYLNNKKIKVLIFSFDEFSYGDCFIIDSEIHIPEKIEDFDYQNTC